MDKKYLNLMKEFYIDNIDDFYKCITCHQPIISVILFEPKDNSKPEVFDIFNNHKCEFKYAFNKSRIINRMFGKISKF